MNPDRRQAPWPWMALFLAWMAAPAGAVEASWSGFATLGYTRSDSPYRAQREIDQDGTWRRDSLIAGQVDLALMPRWSATAQVKLAASPTGDTHWRARTAWAFVAWRPSNDWLIRAGRQYAPVYLHSEQIDIGMAHDNARLPVEMYSLSPTIDFDGISVSHAFTLAGRDASLDAYAGQTHIGYRLWTRDGVPPIVPPGLLTGKFALKALGASLSTRDTDTTLRLGLHLASTQPPSNTTYPVRYPLVELGPGQRYWQVNAGMPGPGVPQADSVRNVVLTAGGDWYIGSGWRVVAELAKPFQLDTELGSDALGGYIGVFKSSGNLTAYALVAAQRSSDRVREWYRRLTTDVLPDGVPGAATINASQRFAAETLFAYDQQSISFGLSYTLSPTSKLKGEWTKTHVGAMSNHFDTPPGLPAARGLHVNTVTVNLNVAF